MTTYKKRLKVLILCSRHHDYGKIVENRWKWVENGQKWEKMVGNGVFGEKVKILVNINEHGC